MIHGSILSIEPETNVENDGTWMGLVRQVDAAKPKEETPAERAARRRSERQQGKEMQGERPKKQPLNTRCLEVAASQTFRMD